MQVIQKSKIDESVALSFAWFEAEFLPRIKAASMEFWESDFELKLFSITNFDTIQKDKLSIGERYYTKQIPLNPHQSATFRMSSEFVRVILHTALGSNGPKFDLSILSELEVKILNSFLEFLCKGLSDVFLNYDEIPKYALKNKEVFNLTFFVKKEDAKATKFVITLPKNVLVPNFLPKERAESYEVSDSFSTFVKVRAGSARITLNDLKMLSVGDIVLLDKSNVNKMYIFSGNFLQEFKINPDLGMIIDLDEDEHDIGGADMAEKNMWDDIQIEVNAEFDKVKMTLGELKQITNGMVIDLADAFSGKISLVVEDKVVARGNLVIINDRYGVRLDEIIQTAGKQSAPKQGQAAPPPVKQAEAVPESDIEEDFDYSDFEDEE